MYNHENKLLVENPINRYSINSTILSSLKFDKDKFLTLYIQRDSPGKDKESNWLPAPKGQFYMLLRMYLPKQEIINGQYEIPPVGQVK
jgi:hypothetical protein